MEKQNPFSAVLIWLKRFVQDFKDSMVQVPSDAEDIPEAVNMPSEASTSPTAPSLPSVSPPQRVYEVAKLCLGHHTAADPNIPDEEGCVTAVVYILRSAGIQIPDTIVGVNVLVDWMTKNGFIEHTSGSIGDVIVAHSPSLGNTSYAHAGIVLQYGIGSNTSFNIKSFSAGLFQENYTIDSWLAFFSSHGSTTRFFTPV